MKLPALSLALLAAAACGGKTKPPATTANTGGAPAPVAASGAAAAWAEVFVEGAKFTLDNNSDGAAATPITLTATVAKVVHDDQGLVAVVVWTDADDHDATEGGLPVEIHLEGERVTFGRGQYATHFPATGAETPDGLYVHTMDDQLCYGVGPGEGAGDCEDVCFAELCVAPGRGITSGSGTWWPNYEVFSQVAK